MSNSLKYMLLALLVVILLMIGLGAMSIITLPGPLSAVNGLIKEKDVAPLTDAPAGGCAPGTIRNPAFVPPTSGATDPAAADPAAVGVVGAEPECIADPAAAASGLEPGAADPGATEPGAVDPGAAGPAASGATPGGAAGTTGAGSNDVGGTTPGAAVDTTKATTDGANSGNSAEAMRVASEVAGVLRAAKIESAVTSMLVPAVGGVAPSAKATAYRKLVTGSVLVIKLVDPTSLEQWTKAPKATRIRLVKGFFTRLGKRFPAATRSITVVDSGGTVLAVGDAKVGGAGTVRVF